MRSIYEIQKEIARVSHLLNNLILEKKLTLERMWMVEESAKKIAEKAIEKAKQ